MNAFLVLLRIRLLDVLRSRSSTGFVLLFPVVLLAVLGLVFMHGHPCEWRYVSIVQTDSTNSAVEASVRKLQECQVGPEAREAEGGKNARKKTITLLRA